MKLTSTNIFLLLALAVAAVWGAYFALESMIAADAARTEMGISDDEGWDEEEEQEQEQGETAAPDAWPLPERVAPSEVTPAEEETPTEAREKTPAPGRHPAAAEQASAADREEELQALADNVEVGKQRYLKLQERFDGEQRDPSWARGKEKRVSNLFRDAGQEKLLVSMECRATLCRLEARVSSASDFLALWEMPGLREELSPESLVLPQGTTDERTLVGYFAKHGYTLERLAR